MSTDQKWVGNVQIVEGEAGDIPQLLSILEGEGITAPGNPDVHVRHHARFGIDDARDLAARAVLKAFGGGRRVFVVAVDAITAEAQNALLKTLEEAPGNALFVFVHPAPMQLLPTVRSRAQILHLPRDKNVGHRMSYISAEDFLRQTPAKRLDMLKSLLEKGDDERRDIGAILAFLASLERSLAKHPVSLVSVYRARKYITDRGALNKPLLEQVALLI